MVYLLISLLVAAPLRVELLRVSFLLHRGATCRPSIRIVLLQLIRGHDPITFKLLHEGILVAAVAVLLIVTANIESLLLTAWLHVCLLLIGSVLRLALLVHLHVLHSPPRLQHQLVFSGEILSTVFKVPWRVALAVLVQIVFRDWHLQHLCSSTGRSVPVDGLRLVIGAACIRL